jgi:hypothetical protein
MSEPDTYLHLSGLGSAAQRPVRHPTLTLNSTPQDPRLEDSCGQTSYGFYCGHPQQLWSFRVAQQFDASMMLAAAATASVRLADDTRVQKFIRDVVAGPAETVERTVEEFRTAPPPYLEFLVGDRLFTAILDRLHRNFSLYVLLDVSQGVHRVLNLSFDEPTDWKLQRPTLTSLVEKRRSYQAGQRVPLAKHCWLYMLAKLGLISTRIRFQIPAAENTASYHFEATAPLGVRIVQASLLAGRPHEPKAHVSVDRVVGHAPIVGLHAVEIPNNSLCRVQLDLRVPARGWLTQLVISCAVIMGVLCSVAVHLSAPVPALTQDQVTNVVVILVSASAATAALVAQRDFHGLAASMVTHLRAVGALSLSLPILAAGYLVYEGIPPLTDGAMYRLRLAMLVLFVASVVLLAAAAAALLLSWLGERNKRAEASPWDMTVRKSTNGGTAVHRRAVVFDDYDTALQKLKFDAPAVGIRSAEGWHETYDWTNIDQVAAERDLRNLRNPLTEPDGVYHCALRRTRCATDSFCPAHRTPTAPSRRPRDT